MSSAGPEQSPQSEEPTLYLDHTDPIDYLLLAKNKRLSPFEELPTLAAQRRQIAHLQATNFESPEDFLYEHRGLAAAVAFDFKDPLRDSRQLLNNAYMGLLAAASRWSPSSEFDFSDYAILIMEAKLQQAQPAEAVKPVPDRPSGRPMDRMLRLVSRVDKAEVKIAQQPSEGTQPRPSIPRLSLNETIVLPYIHLRSHEVEQLTGISADSVSTARSGLRRKFNTPSFERVAVMAYEAGVKFDTQPVDPLDDLLREEASLVVANRLGQAEGSNTEGTSPSPKEENALLKRLQAQAGARTRTELALMVAAFRARAARAEKLRLSAPRDVVIQKLGATSLAQ